MRRKSCLVLGLKATEIAQKGLRRWVWSFHEVLRSLVKQLFKLDLPRNDRIFERRPLIRSRSVLPEVCMLPRAEKVAKMGLILPHNGVCRVLIHPTHLTSGHLSSLYD